MPLDVATTAEEEVDVPMAKDAVEDAGGESDDIEKDTVKEVVEEAVAHLKMVLTSHMSPITLMMQSWSHSQTRQEKG